MEEKTQMTDQTAAEISYGIKVFWPWSPADVNLLSKHIRLLRK